jgi:DNA-binding SARP family transcriptional activator
MAFGTLNIRLLDERPTAVFDDAGLRIHTPPRVPVLLTYLLLHRDRPQARDDVAFALWPDDSEDEARANLRRHLNYLRSALASCGDGYVTGDRTHVGWNTAAPLELDVDAFERESADPERRESAVERYRADLVSCLDEPFLVAPRERLRARQLANLDFLILRERAAGDYASALRYAGRRRALDEWCEVTLRRNLVLRAESGDRSGALALYETFVRRLHEEVGAGPMPASRALAEALRTNLPLPPGDFAPVADAAPVAGARPTAIFVGRAREREQLDERWSAVAAGRGAVLFVSGAAGIGKSRLLRRLVLDVAERGGASLWGTPSDPEAFAYEPFAEALAPYAAGLGGALEGPLLHALQRIVPHAGTAGDGTCQADGTGERERLFESVARALQSVRANRPLVLVIDDAHRCGDASLDLFAFLAHRLRDEPVLLAAAYRDDETPRTHPLQGLRRTLASTCDARSLTLAPLGEAEIATYIRALASNAPDIEALAAYVTARSEGNPLVAGELVHDALESGRRPGELPALAATGVPPVVAELVSRRVARLSARTRAVAAVGATLGRAFAAETVAECGGWSEAEADAGLHELLDRKLVRDTGGAHVEFTHDLVRACIYGAQSAAERRGRHARVARVLADLEAHDDAAAERIARHFEAANEPAEALAHLRRAVAYAKSVFARREAKALAGRAIALAQTSDARCEFLLDRAAMSALLGEREDERRDLDELLETARRAGDVRFEFDVRLRIATHARELGDPDGERAQIERAAELLAQIDDPRRRALLLLQRGRSLNVSADLALTEQLQEEALALLGPGDPLRLELLVLLTDRARLRGDLAAARERYAGCREELARAPALDRELLTLRAASRIAAAADEAEELYGIGERVLALARRIGDARSECDAASILYHAACALGRLEAALAFASEGIATSARSGYHDLLSACHRGAAMALRLLGRYREARVCSAEAERVAIAAHDSLAIALALDERTRGALLDGDLDEAARLSADFLSAAAFTNASMVCAIARQFHAAVLVERGDAAAARPLLEACVPELLELYGRSTALGELYGVIAHARAAAGDRAGALTAAEQTERHLTSLPVDTDAVHGLFHAALARERCGDRAGAARLRRQAGRRLADLARRTADESRAEFDAVPWHAALLAVPLER